MKKDFVCQEGFATKYGVSVIITRKNVECFMRPLICCFQEDTNETNGRKNWLSSGAHFDPHSIVFQDQAALALYLLLSII
jgi:hypothetical protein